MINLVTPGKHIISTDSQHFETFDQGKSRANKVKI